MSEELKKKIDKIIEGHLIRCADQILSLIEGELKKAEKWDRIEYLVTAPCDRCPLQEPCMRGRYCLVGMLTDGIESAEVNDEQR